LLALGVAPVRGDVYITRAQHDRLVVIRPGGLVLLPFLLFLLLVLVFILLIALAPPFRLLP
jgi:hypothetical protein